MKELLEVLIDAGPRLINAGYAEVSAGGVTIKLAPAVPVPSKQAIPTPDPVARQHVDPMRDPSTYPGGHVPGYTDDKPATVRNAPYPWGGERR